jgi:hypothetical protein
MMFALTCVMASSNKRMFSFILSNTIGLLQPGFS